MYHVSRFVCLALVIAVVKSDGTGEFISQYDYANSTRVKFTNCASNGDGESIYDHSFLSLDETSNVSLSEFRNKVLLIFNAATFCASTVQYRGANALKERFGADHPFEVIAFPCNQFGLQEPAKGKDELLNGLKWVRPGGEYVPNFPLAAKVDVNGANEHAIFNYLKRSCPATRTKFSSSQYLFYKPMHVRDIRWNFEKFLIDGTTGLPYRRYDGAVDPNELADDIQFLISKLESNKLMRDSRNATAE